MNMTGLARNAVAIGLFAAAISLPNPSRSHAAGAPACPDFPATGRATERLIGKILERPSNVFAYVAALNGAELGKSFLVHIGWTGAQQPDWSCALRFPVGKSNVNALKAAEAGPEMRQAILILAAFLAKPELKNLHLKLVGHADQDGKDIDNDRIGYRRAESAAAYMRDGAGGRYRSVVQRVSFASAGEADRWPAATPEKSRRVSIQIETPAVAADDTAKGGEQVRVFPAGSHGGATFALVLPDSAGKISDPSPAFDRAIICPGDTPEADAARAAEAAAKVKKKRIKVVEGPWPSTGWVALPRAPDSVEGERNVELSARLRMVPLRDSSSGGRVSARFLLELAAGSGHDECDRSPKALPDYWAVKARLLPYLTGGDVFEVAVNDDGITTARNLRARMLFREADPRKFHANLKCEASIEVERGFECRFEPNVAAEILAQALAHLPKTFDEVLAHGFNLNRHQRYVDLRAGMRLCIETSLTISDDQYFQQKPNTELRPDITYQTYTAGPRWCETVSTAGQGPHERVLQFQSLANRFRIQSDAEAARFEPRNTALDASRDVFKLGAIASALDLGWLTPGRALRVFFPRSEFPPKPGAMATPGFTQSPHKHSRQHAAALVSIVPVTPGTSPDRDPIILMDLLSGHPGTVSEMFSDMCHGGAYGNQSFGTLAGVQYTALKIADVRCGLFQQRGFPRPEFPILIAGKRQYVEIGTRFADLVAAAAMHPLGREKPPSLGALTVLSGTPSRDLFIDWSDERTWSLPLLFGDVVK
jgi:hypothetical protein